LSSLRSLEFTLHVLTIDGASLPVASCGILSIPSFYVPDVSHIPCLTTNLFSAAQLTDSGYRVILDVDSCSLWDDCTKAMVGAGPRRNDSHLFFSNDTTFLVIFAVHVYRPYYIEVF
jgi:hypothetical protein